MFQNDFSTLITTADHVIKQSNSKSNLLALKSSVLQLKTQLRKTKNSGVSLSGMTRIEN